MAEEWKDSFDNSKFSNQWEHIYVAGWKAGKEHTGVLKPLYNSTMVPTSQIYAAANQWADGNPNCFGVNGFLAGVEWMRKKFTSSARRQ